MGTFEQIKKTLLSTPVGGSKEILQFHGFDLADPGDVKRLRTYIQRVAKQLGVQYSTKMVKGHLVIWRLTQGGV